MNYPSRCGRVAQLGEHLLCKQGVTGSIPVTSTNRSQKVLFTKLKRAVRSAIDSILPSATLARTDLTQIEIRSFA